MPIIKGCTPTINPDSAMPNCGNNVNISAAKPATILPTKAPIALPIRAKVAPPSAINSLKPGILDRPPNANKTSVKPPVSAINAPIAGNASIAAGPSNVRTASTPVIVTAKRLNAMALFIAPCTFCIRAKTPTKANNGTAIVKSARAPIYGAPVSPAAPIIVNGISNNVITVANANNAMTLSLATVMFRIRAKTPTKANKGIAIAVRAKTPIKASLAVLPTMFITASTPVITTIKPPRIKADVIADSAGIVDSKYTAPAITAIAAVSAMILPKQFLANPVTAIRPAIITDSTLTIMRPRFMFSGGTKLNKTAINASTPIAPAILRIVFPILSASLPTNLVAAMRPTMIPENAVIIKVPLAKPSQLTMLSMNAVRAIIAMAPDMARRLVPILSTFLLPEINFVAAIKPTMIPPKAIIAMPP